MNKNKNNSFSEIKNSEDRSKSKASKQKSSASGINNPEIAIPAFNPPVPNRAWTEMKKELEQDYREKKESEDFLSDEYDDF